MITHGSVQTKEYNINCQGAKFVINNEQHSNMLEYQTVRLSTVELSIQVGKQEVQELRDNIILDTECITNMKCIVGVHTYLVFSKNVN